MGISSKFLKCVMGGGFGMKRGNSGGNSIISAQIAGIKNTWRATSAQTAGPGWTVLDMSEYIKKEDVLKEIESTAMWSRPYGELYEDVQDMQAADVAPVRHGHWIETYGNDCWYYDCSNCDDGYATTERDNNKPNYCQNCGAKMDLEDHDGK